MSDDTATRAQLQINRLQELPPLSLVSQRLLETLADDNVAMDEVARVIELDPALAARIVGVARSAFFGNTSTIFNVKDAVIRVLGLDMVRSLALSISFGNSLRYERVRRFDAAAYWTTALLTADMARYLAPRVTVADKPAADPAYLAGLLHNLGVLALAHLFPAELSQAMEAADGAPWHETAPFEREAVGIDHHSAGGWLARRWHLPEEVITTMEHYHQDDYRGPLWSTAMLVGSCARWAEWRRHDEAGIPDAVAASLAGLGIAGKDMGRLVQAFERKYEQTSQMAASLSQGTL